MSKPLLFWLALLLMFSGGSTVWFALRANSLSSHQALPESHSPEDDTPLDKLRTLEEFELVDQQGKKFGTADLEGHVWVGSFFFTSCPGVCVRQNQAVQQLQERFKDRGLKLVSITCDPDRDTPAVMAAYSQRFLADPDSWKFLTGDLKYIEQIGRDFFLLSVGKEQHGSHLVVFDRQGELQGAFGATHAERFEELCALVDKLLKES